MSDVAATALVSLGVAAVTGLTILAYKQPWSYIKLHPFLAGALGVFIIGPLIWNASNDAVFYAVVRYEVVGDKFRVVSDAVRDLHAPGWWIVVGVGALFYLMFLSSFPFWLVENEPAKPVDDVPNQRKAQADKAPLG